MNCYTFKRISSISVKFVTAGLKIGPNIASIAVSVCENLIIIVLGLEPAWERKII
jgi:hypothetical protein